MKNHKLYIQAPWDAPEKKRELDVAFDGVSKYHDVIFDKEKAKYEDVPTEYRRNRKQDALRVATIVVCCLFILNCILFFASL